MSTEWAAGAILAATFGGWLLLLVYVFYNVWLLWLAWRLRDAGPQRPAPPRELPRVTLQLPVYNEETVVARLLEAVGRIDYPRHLLDVQLLDDSNDATPRIAAPIVERLRAQGLQIAHLRRDTRDDFKAGALRAGLATAQGELLLILDADFVPPPTILHDVVAWFTDPEVAMVQLRWGHLREPRSVIERCARYWIDRHFAIEQVARSRSGQFFHFNGSAGAWRRAAIEAAGGWSAATLAEDLDLSFRAWRQRWRFVFDPATVVPAELPASAPALRVQQSRWARGAFQMAKRAIPQLKDAGWYARLHVSLHLTGYCFPLILLGLALLSGATAWARGQLPGVWALAADVPAGVFACVLVGQVLFRIRQAGLRAGLVELEASAIGIALAPLILRAGLAGLRREGGTFHRTPKSSRASGVIAPAVLLDAGLGLAALASAGLAVWLGGWLCAVLPLIAGTGLLQFAVLTLRPDARVEADGPSKTPALASSEQSSPGTFSATGSG